VLRRSTRVPVFVIRALKRSLRRKALRATSLRQGFNPALPPETSIRLSAALGVEAGQVFVLMTEHRKMESQSFI
jgi:hypothetical protein